MPHNSNRSDRSVAVYITLALLVWVVSAAAFPSDVKLTDGNPKRLMHCGMWSWRLQIKEAMLDAYGLQNVTLSGYCGQNIPVTDDMTLDPKGWFYTFKEDYGSRLQDTATYMIVFTNEEYIDPSDADGLNREVDRMLVLENAFKELGVHEVFFSTRHYMLGRAPYLGSDWRLSSSDTALARVFNERTQSCRAIDMFTPSRSLYPLTVLSDHYHPSAFGRRFYVLTWIKAMFRHEGLPQPATIDSDIENFRTDALRKRQAVQARITTPDADTVRMGSTLSFEVEFDRTVWSPTSISVVLNAYRGEIALQHFVETIPVNQSGLTEHSFTLPEKTGMVFRLQYPKGYSGANVPLLPCDSVSLQLSRPLSGQEFAAEEYWFSRGIVLVNEDGSGNPYTATRGITRHNQPAPPPCRAAVCWSARSRAPVLTMKAGASRYDIRGRRTDIAGGVAGYVLSK